MTHLPKLDENKVLRPWTKEHDDIVRNMDTDGNTADDLAADLERSRQAIIQRKSYLKTRDASGA